MITGDHRHSRDEGLELKAQFTLLFSVLNFSSRRLLKIGLTLKATCWQTHCPNIHKQAHAPRLLIVQTAAVPLARTRGEEFPVFNRQKCVNLWFFTLGRRQMDSFTLSLFSARAGGSACKRCGYPQLIKGAGWELEGGLDRWTVSTKEPGIFEP